MLVALAFAITALVWRRNKYGKAEFSRRKEISTETQTVVVDPESGKEIIVSDFGEDNVSDPGAIELMEERLATLSEDIDRSLGEVPSKLVYRVYNKLGKIVDSKEFDPKLTTA